MVRGPHFEVAGARDMVMKNPLKISTWFRCELDWLLVWAVFTIENFRLPVSPFLLPGLSVIIVPFIQLIFDDSPVCAKHVVHINPS